MKDKPAVDVAMSSLYLSSDGADIDVSPKAILLSVAPFPKVKLLISSVYCVHSGLLTNKYVL